MKLWLKNAGMSLVVLFMLVSGCGSDLPAATASSSPSAAPIAVATDFHSVSARAETLARYVVQNNWQAIAGFFSPSSSQSHSAADLQAAYLSASGGALANGVIDSCARLDGDLMTGFATVQAGEVQVRLRVRVDANREVLSLHFMRLPKMDALEETDEYTETVVSVGRDPSVKGILTMPKDHAYPYIGILMPSKLEDGMDAMGDNTSFRRQLAHALAAAGVATIRYDMRLYEDPFTAEEDGWSLDLLMNQDLAWTVHHLDQYPVDATNIFYVGCGALGGLGFGEMAEHYEMTKGLVLMNVPYTEDGLALFGMYYGLDEETVAIARRALEADDPDLTQIIGDYPLSYWKQWQTLANEKVRLAGNYRRLVLSDDASLYDAWDQGTKRYSELQKYDSFAGEDGTMRVVAADIAAWLDGEDLPSKVEEQKKTDKKGRKS